MTLLISNITGALLLFAVAVFFLACKKDSDGRR